MYINHVRTGWDGASVPAARETPLPVPVKATQQQGPGDLVQLSGTAKALAAAHVDPELTPARIDYLRQQIVAGKYPEPALVEALAWRLIEAGIV